VSLLTRIKKERKAILGESKVGSIFIARSRKDFPPHDTAVKEEGGFCESGRKKKRDEAVLEGEK